MVNTDHMKAGKTAAALLACAVVASLAGCEERPYPSPAHERVAPPPPPADLAGPAYAPPPVYAAPAPTATVTESYTSTTTTSGSPTVYDLPPVQSGGYASSGDSQVIYDLGPVVGSHGRVHTQMYGSAPAPQPRTYAPPAYRPRVYHAPKAPMAPPKAGYVAPKPMAPAPKPAPTTYGAKADHAATSAGTAVHNTAVAAGAAATAAAAKASDAAHKAAMAARNGVAKVETHSTTTTTTSTTDKAAPAADNKTAAGDRTSRLASLQTALTSAVSAKAALAIPDKMAPGQPVDVSLTLPAEFAETVRKEAEKQGLADAAASVNMTAILAGDGYAVTPDETQSQPLTVGQPTEFHWTVTAQPNAKGPLHADVGADLLGGGSDTLSLGTVQKGGVFGSMKLTPRMVGAGILALIVILVLGWLARGRSTPSRAASARRASRRARGSGAYVDRPLDMGTETRDPL